MKRWRAAWIGALLAGLLVLCFHSSSASLLRDTDTSTLIATVRAKHAPFSWFLSDWPLYNHFYRPIPTLTFELDSFLYGDKAAGYGWTNALLAAGCTFGLFWFLAEILEKASLALLGTWTFALWQTGRTGWAILPLSWALWLVLAAGIARHKKNWHLYAPAVLGLLFLRELLNPLEPLQARMLEWLPGRTASCMAVFCLVGMAAYARFEKLGGSKAAQRPPSPLDPPATRNSRTKEAGNPVRWPWAVVAVLCTIGALASYEQAVMLPACLLGIAVFFRLSGYRPKWSLQIAFWMLLGGYLLLRHQIIPAGKSAYQAQQLRSGSGGAQLDLLEMLFPPSSYLGELGIKTEQGLYVLLDPGFYSIIFEWVVYSFGVYVLAKMWRPALTGWLLCFISFLPMAFLKLFEHYYYWPMALRTLLVVSAAAVVWKLVVIALCPPVLQAPPRPRPAPGSLPHP